MKQVLFIYCFLLSTLSYGQVADSGKYTITADSFLVMMDKKNSEYINKPFTQFSITTNNKKCSNKTLKGKVVFINFWFAACAPCMAEMNELNKLFKHFKKSKNFEFVSFTFESPTEIELIKRKYNIHYNIFSISQDECYRLNNNNGFPTSIILNATGFVKWIHSTDAVNKTEIEKYFTGDVYPVIEKEL